jgi:2-methylcitrate dehydratase PrpD
MDTTRQLASFLVKSKPEHIPEAARREATRSLLNWVGCAIGGAHHEAVNRSLAALAELSIAPQATVLGRPERLDLLHATLINGMSSHVLDFDDTHLRSLLHASGSIVPALLALSEMKPLDGQAFLHAFILGVEVESRIANAICHNHNADWYITGTAGPFGAAAAIGKVLGLDEQRMTWALGLAATLGAGLREMGGTMANSLVHGRAGQNGLYAAMLAAKGFTSSEHALEGPRGFAKVLGGVSDTSPISAHLGETYEITLNTYKPFACGVVAHPVIDGCIRLRCAYNIKPNAISHVALKVHPQALKLTGIKSPRSGLESKWSIFHSAAVVLIRGVAGEHEYTDTCVMDPEIALLREKVAATADESLRQDEAHVTVTLQNGQVLTQHVEHALGSAQHPLSDADLEAKVVGLTKGVVSEQQIERLIQLCWSAADLKDVAEISRQAVPLQS